MTIGLGLVVAAVGYALAYGAASRAGRTVPPLWRAYAFLAGVAILALALAGPLDESSAALFSAHMVQHLLLMIASPPLIALGRPVQVLLRGLPSAPRRAVLRQTLGRPAVRGALTRLLHPIALGLLVNGSVLAWHLPTLYSAALTHPLVHELEHASFFISSLLFWWALVGPELPRAHRLSPTASLLLLFATWMASDLLGATLALASTLLYSDYAATPKPFGLTALADQRLGGIIMWVAGGAFYAVVMVGMLIAPYIRSRAAPHGVTLRAEPPAPAAARRSHRAFHKPAAERQV